MQKKIWKLIFVFAGILVGAGIICAVVSLFMGGSLSTLMENKDAAATVQLLSPAAIWSQLLAIFGL